MIHLTFYSPCSWTLSSTSTANQLIRPGTSAYPMRQFRLSHRYWIGHSPRRKAHVQLQTPQVNAIILSDEHPPTQIFTSDTGAQGEVLQLGFTYAQPIDEYSSAFFHTHIVVLPGNPGVIEYYRPFVRMLWQRLPPHLKLRCHIHALGLPGHDLRQLNGGQQFDISDHTNYCISYLRSKVLTPSLKESRILFIGHSYGSFLALNIVERLNVNESYDSSLVMLMPALWRMGYCCGVLIRFILRDWLGLCSWILWLLTAVVPPIIREAILRVIIRDEEARSVSRTMVDGRRRYLYANMGSLGRDEKIQITDPRRLPSIATLTGRSLLVYVNEDKWCPPTGRRAIVDAFKGFVDVVTPGDTVEHAFVLSQCQIARVVDVIVPWITERVCDAGESESEHHLQWL